MNELIEACLQNRRDAQRTDKKIQCRDIIKSETCCSLLNLAGLGERWELQNAKILLKNERFSEQMEIKNGDRYKSRCL